MAWIKLEISTADKPEVWAIAEALSIDPDAALGKLIRVWAWFDTQTTAGNAPSVTKSLLDRIVGVTGFCESMISVGWMIDDGGKISLPNFDRHNGQTAKTRALTAKRVLKHKQKGNAAANDEVTHGALPRLDKRKRRIIERDKPDSAPENWVVPPHLDSPVVRDLLARFAEMRNKIKKPIKSIRDASAILPRFDDLDHLQFALETCIANQYQGLKPDYRPTTKKQTNSTTAQMYEAL